MSQDIVSDTLNMIMNASKAGKKNIVVKRHSSLLISVLAFAKLKGYVKSFNLDDKSLNIEIGKIHGCKAIKPRFIVGVDDIEKYSLRYLPAKNIGTIIISTNQGLMAHQTAVEKNIGGCLIAYFY